MERAAPCGSGGSGGGASGASASGSGVPGRGRRLTLDVHTTTGGTFALTADAKASVDHLKKLVSRRLKVPKERICLLHRERQLRDGTLEDNGLIDGSRIILLPSVETGLLTQRPENSVMQALESLNDSQVNDFLSGKSPLNLTMRLGDHMMLIQLQLSTFPGGSANAASGSKSRSTTASHRSVNRPVTPSIKTNDSSSKMQKPTIILGKSTNETKPGASASTSAPSTSSSPISKPAEPNEAKKSPVDSENVDDFKPFLCKQDIETLQNAFEIFKSLAEMQEDISKESDDMPCDAEKTKTKFNYSNDSSSTNNSDFEDQSPIKSLSNLVSSPLKSSLTASYPLPAPIAEDDSIPKEDKPPPKYVPLPSSLKNNLINRLVEDQKDSKVEGNSSHSPIITDPIAANLTSCLCSSFNFDYNCASNCQVPDHEYAKVENNASLPESNKEICEDEVFPTENKCAENAWNERVADEKESKEKLSPESGSASTSSNEKSNNSVSPESSIADQVPKQSKNKRLHYLLHKASKPGNQTIQNKPKAFMQSLVNKHLKKKMQQSINNTDSTDLGRPSTSKMDAIQNSCPASNHFEALDEMPSKSNYDNADTANFSPTPSTSSATKADPQSPQISDTNSLVEASKNLTQTLKKLSKEVLTSKVDLTNEETARPKIGQGAVIESMKHHGKGIYSGTFSGTLNPALQDRFGRPKRDISTIIHILNDLLCATPPQYRRGARITFEPTHNTQSTVRARQRELRNSTFNCAADQNGADECNCSKCNSTLNMCPYGECNGHYSSPTPASDSVLAPLDICTCKKMEVDDNPTVVDSCTCTSEGPPCTPNNTPVKKCYVCDKDKDDNHKIVNKTCRKCNSASTLALDNSKTKCKLDQLRLVMQQKKERREARKMKAAPYPSTTNNVNLTQSDQGVITEEIETVA